MSTRFETVLRESSDLVDTGLRLLDGLLDQARNLVQPGRDAAAAAVDATGPRTIDGAVSELSNRLVRFASITRPEEAPSAWRETVETALEVFAGAGGPRAPLPRAADILLSSATLSVQQLRRGSAAFHTLEKNSFSSFTSDVIEVFDDAHVYATLTYRDVIARRCRRLEQAPDDTAARIELARTYIKCGLYHDAIRELRIAAEDRRLRPRALHELAVAECRAGRYRDALASAREAMQLGSTTERTRLLLWMAADRCGGYPADVPSEFRMEVRSGHHPTRLVLDDLAAQLGMDKTSGGRGTAVFDYDGDGWLDVLIAAAHGGCTLYHNNGNGTFTDVSIPSGMDRCLTAFITAVGDYDNDGHPDLFITRNGFFSGDCSLYHNNGDGTFTDVTAEAGLVDWGPAFTASWVDYDGDGRLDLFVVYNLGTLFERKTRNRLFHNNGDGTFTDVTDRAGLVTEWPTIGSAWGDYDNDGRPDLFLSNSIGRSQLYHNNGDGTFSDVSREAGLDKFGIGSVCFWIDYDHDGWLDLVQYIWSDAEEVVHTLRHGEGPPDGQPIRLWRNNHDGTFSLRSRELGVTGCWGSMSGNAGDINNDGYFDLFLGNGSPRMERAEPLVLLESDGRRFRDVTFTAGLPFAGKSHGVNLADLFGDGRLSLIVASGGAYPGDILTTGVFVPRELLGHYLNVRLVGTLSNRDAIGARITLDAGGRARHALVSGGSQFGCLPFEQHFGLGETTQVDGIEIWWPSGLRQRLGPMAADNTIRITEGDDHPVDVYPRG